MLTLLLACAHPAPPVLAEAPAVSDAVEGAPIPDGPLKNLLAEARAGGPAWEKLRSLCDEVGHRLSGSEGALRAIAWGVERLQVDGFVDAHAETVMVPAWFRGAERLTLLSPEARPLPLLGLGGTVGTDGPLEAEVVVLSSMEELSPAVAGKIVLFDQPMREGVPAVRQYGEAVGVRVHGPSRAAALGAVGVLIRSVTTRSLSTPHTGTLRYDPEQARIPAAALTPEDAGWLHRRAEAGAPIRVRLELEGQTGPDAENANVIAEIRGTEWPEQIVVVSGHLDSWDVGQGAQDDGAGVVHAMEALRLVAAHGPPKRTVRAVLFANEENGGRGGDAYFAAHGQETHVAAIESDLGAGWPAVLSARSSETQLAWLERTAAPLGLRVEQGYGGSDIGPLAAGGVLLIGNMPDDSHYFDIHHTWADTLDKVDPKALNEGVAAIAGLTWLLANAPDAPLPTGLPHPE